MARRQRVGQGRHLHSSVLGCVLVVGLHSLVSWCVRAGVRQLGLCARVPGDDAAQLLGGGQLRHQGEHRGGHPVLGRGQQRRHCLLQLRGARQPGHRGGGLCTLCIVMEDWSLLKA